MADYYRRRARAQAHAKRPHHCTCGKVVWGNGGEFNHRAMHERKGDGHGFVGARRYYELFPNARGAPMLPNETLDEYQARIDSGGIS